MHLACMRLILICLLQFCFIKGSLGNQLLPDVPRVGLHVLYEQSRNGRQGKPPKQIISEGERFLVVGTAVRAPEGQGEERWYLIGGVRACCNMLQVGLPLRGGNEFKEGQWIAVHGVLDRSGPEWALSSLVWKGQPVFLGGDDLGISVEDILPAEKIIHTNNIIDSLSSDSLSSFKQALEWSGLENELRAVDAATLLIPHNVAIQRSEKFVLRQPSTQKELQELRHWVLGHLVEGRWSTSGLLNANELTMMNGDVQSLVLENGSFKIGGCRILMKNIAGQNGVAHIIMPVLPVTDFSEKNVLGNPGTFSSDPLDL